MASPKNRRKSSKKTARISFAQHTLSGSLFVSSVMGGFKNYATETNLITVKFIRGGGKRETGAENIPGRTKKDANEEEGGVAGSTWLVSKGNLGKTRRKFSSRRICPLTSTYGVKGFGLNWVVCGHDFSSVLKAVRAVHVARISCFYVIFLLHLNKKLKIGEFCQFGITVFLLGVRWRINKQK